MGWRHSILLRLWQGSGPCLGLCPTRTVGDNSPTKERNYGWSLMKYGGSHSCFPTTTDVRVVCGSLNRPDSFSSKLPPDEASLAYFCSGQLHSTKPVSGYSVIRYVQEHFDDMGIKLTP